MTMTSGCHRSVHSVGVLRVGHTMGDDVGEAIGFSLM